MDGVPTTTDQRVVPAGCPDEVVDRGLPRPLSDKSAAVVIWIYSLEPARGGDLTRNRSLPHVLPGSPSPVQLSELLRGRFDGYRGDLDSRADASSLVTGVHPV